MEHARCPACLQHPNEAHGVAQPCPRGFAPVLTGAIWAAAAELLPAVWQLADRSWGLDGPPGATGVLSRGVPPVKGVWGAAPGSPPQAPIFGGFFD